MSKDKLKRRLHRLTEMKNKLESKYNGNETQYTFHAGFDLGYLKGKIHEIEERLDDLNEEKIG